MEENKIKKSELGESQVESRGVGKCETEDRKYIELKRVITLKTLTRCCKIPSIFWLNVTIFNYKHPSRPPMFTNCTTPPVTDYRRAYVRDRTDFGNR